MSVVICRSMSERTWGLTKTSVTLLYFDAYGEGSTSVVPILALHVVS
jgi:hypothetical protein